MRTIQAKATITEDRRLILQLPSDVTPGEHRVVVLLDPPTPAEDTVAETPVRWEDGVLVYDGEIVGPIETAIEDSQVERMRHILGEYQQ